MMTDFRAALELAQRAAANQNTIVLVEGVSDELALAALAERRGLALESAGVTTIAMGGATNIGYFLNLLGPQGLNAEVAGLCDVGEERLFRTALERAGFGASLTRAEMEAFGFYVCDVDLEDELIRAVGAERVLSVAAVQGELSSFRTLQKQSAWKGRRVEAQLRRWIGAKAQRKGRYATLLVNALDLDHVPMPLDRLLVRVTQATRGG